MTEFYVRLAAVTSAVAIAAWYVFFGPSTVSIQRGYEGVGMDHVYNRAVLGETALDNEVPAAIPMTSLEGERAAVAYKNVQVLGGLSSAQFTRLMLSITQWVSPEQGCNYCHNPNNMASDELYTKHVARRMFQMTQHINENWQTHVKETGVTCYTCHRGQPVPKYIWFNEPRHKYADRMLGDPAGQNIAGKNVTLTSLPTDPFTPFLEVDSNIRVIGTKPLPPGNRSSIKQAEWTYGLMIHMSDGLGVNCTYCHNSRSFAEWKQSPPARTTAWYGIRMVRDLNGAYTKPLLEYYPDERKGPTGDAPKVNCKTCHQGAYKPLLGKSMLKDFPGLAKSSMYVPPPPPQDTDGDGMFDDTDLCPDAPETKNFFRDSDGCADEVPEALTGVTGTIKGVEFTANGDLTRGSRRILTRAARVLRNFEDMRIAVQVHSDDSGDAEADAAATQARADTVRQYMVSSGIDEARISAKGYGATQPLPPGEDGQPAAASNSRVDFSIE